MNKYKIFAIALLAIVLTVSVNIKVSHAVLPMPFGGLVTVVNNCADGSSALVTVQEFAGIKRYLWTRPKEPYLTNLMRQPRIGQFLLGMSLMAPIPCFASYVPPVLYGIGNLMWFHGSSN